MAKRFFKVPVPVVLKILLCFFVSFFPKWYLNALTESDDVDSALVYLNRAYSFYTSGKFEYAHTAVNEGISCSDTVADLFYLRALLYEEENYPAADILKSASEAFEKKRTWFRFDPGPAAVFTSDLLVETRRYQEALSLLDSRVLYPSPDADLLRCRIYYSEGAVSVARNFFTAASKRWSSDDRFPLLFFQFEEPLLDTDSPEKLVMETASWIISAWNIVFNPDVSAELSLAAVPFINTLDSDSARMVMRRIWYMDGTKSLPDYYAAKAVLEAFKAGLIAGEEAVNTFFEYSASGISLRDLSAFCSAALNDEEACVKIAEKLSQYDGLISEDSNNDCIPDSFVSYRLGRPSSAVYDLNQDGYQDMIIECGFGEPVSVIIPSGDIAVEYDTYPFPSSVKTGSMMYSLRRKSVQISPVEPAQFNFGFLTSSFFFLNPSEDFVFPSHKNLASAAVSSVAAEYEPSFSEQENAYNEIFMETVYDGQGNPLSSRQIKNGAVFSRTVYKNGIPFESERDENGDNFFERKIFYDDEGKVLSISVDTDCDKFPDYTENFNEDGSLHISWFEDGKFLPAVQWTKMPDGSSSAVWLHPETSIPVTVLFQDGDGKETGGSFTVSYRGNSRKIIYDEASGFWWFDNIPQKSIEIASLVNSRINLIDSPVVSLTVELEKGFVYVVKIGGRIFAEIIYAG